MNAYEGLYHYLKAIKAAGSMDMQAVMAKMKELKVDDPTGTNGIPSRGWPCYPRHVSLRGKVARGIEIPVGLFQESWDPPRRPSISLAC
ncbi:ABC transporter substrate-binding protein [Bradyrhizobium uaiense]|uniref:ABC transporter substrate-binding protein n=1 Tax=Bradyrhizobium uaiense TaxID=2594946 RepID=UPI0032221F87